MKYLPADAQTVIRGLLCAFTVLLAVYAGVIAFGENGYLELRQMRAELAEIRSVNASVEQKNNALHQTVHRLKTDPVYIEHIIRTQLQMNAPGEIIFKFTD